jgi:hypothetical protein
MAFLEAMPDLGLQIGLMERFFFFYVAWRRLNVKRRPVERRGQIIRVKADLANWQQDEPAILTEGGSLPGTAQTM